MERSSLLLSSAVVLLFICRASIAKYGDINDHCKSELTGEYAHMAPYVGWIQTIEEAEHENGDKYHYVLGVCVDVSHNTKYDGCGAMQYGIGDNNLTHCLGYLSSAQVSKSGDKVWMELTYRKGSNYGSHCKQAERTARIVFLCDPYIRGKGRVEFLEENNEEDNICYYLFNVVSGTVCGPYHLNPGDIIIIIFLCILLLWLCAMIGGVLYKRFSMGAKGWEQVPLLVWYREFGNLEADGCDLVCRTRRNRLIEYKEPSFGADTDDEDEEKDDNLLPM